MSGFLLLHWDPRDPVAAATASRLRPALPATTPVAVDQPGLLIAGEGDPVVLFGPGIARIGQAFPTPGQALPRLERTDAAGFRELSKRSLAQSWGDYHLVHHDPAAPAVLRIFAEPIGARRAETWVHRGVRVVTADAERWLERFPPAALAIDHDALAAIVARPGSAGEHQPLAGVSSIEPGALSHFNPDGDSVERLWTPRDFCDERTDRTPAELEALVDRCVAAWRGDADTVLLELSGGLDSAIVAAALTAGPAPPPTGFTVFADDLAGDERRFARATAQRLGLAIDEIPLPVAPIDEQQLAGLAAGLRPGIGSTTLFHDAALAACGKALGAEMLFTGRGGDALFFQHPTAFVAADRWPTGRPRSLAGFEPLARWARSSVWSVAARAWLPSRPSRDSLRPTNRFAAAVLPPSPSRWAGSLDGLSPAKRMQLVAIAGDRAAFGPSRCAQTLRVVHPLLSQPLVEYALATSVVTLTEGRRDRALLRQAYAGRLPAMMVERRGKGSLSGVFGRILAMSVPMLREQLLGGALADAGLLDRPRLEAALDRDHLMQVDCYTELLALLVIERWLRHWRDRLAQPAP